MTGRVGVIDYGASGNIASVCAAAAYAGGEITIIRSVGDFDGVSHVIIPGVGSFQNAMRALEESGLKHALLEVARETPTLGICVGMQIMAGLGFEFGETEGLDLVGGEVKRMKCKRAVPHIGFNRVNNIGESSLFQDIGPASSFYFMHSYEMVNYTDVLALTEYAGHQFVSAINKRNIYGVQFHPEKSREPGIQLLRNFLSIKG